MNGKFKVIEVHDIPNGKNKVVFQEVGAADADLSTLDRIEVTMDKATALVVDKIYDLNIGWTAVEAS